MSRSVHTLCDEKIEQLSADLADARQKLAASESKLALLMDTFAKHQRSTIDSRNDYALNAARAEVEKCDLRAQRDQAVALACAYGVLQGKVLHRAYETNYKDKGHVCENRQTVESIVQMTEAFLDRYRAKIIAVAALNPPPGDGEAA